MALLCSRTGLVGLVQREGDDFLGQNLGSLIWTQLETPIKWMEVFRFSSSNESVVHCGIWQWWGNTAPCCHMSKADGKHCLVLHVPAAAPSSGAQEKMMTIYGTEPHHSSWQCKESHRCCCHGPLALLTMRDSGTSTILTRDESMWLRYLRQSETTTVRDPVHHNIWTYPCYRVVNAEHKQRWTCWCCTMLSKHFAKGDK